MRLDCAVQHCPVVISQATLQACDGTLSKSNKNLRPGSMKGCGIGRIVLVHHFDALTVDFQARLHEVQHRCTVKSAHGERCAAPPRPPSAASATTASSSTAASPAWSQSSCCRGLGRPFFRWRRVAVQIAPSCTQNYCKHLGFADHEAVVREFVS